MPLEDQPDRVDLESPSLSVQIDTRRGGQILFVGRPGGDNVLFHADWPTPLPATATAGYGSDALDWLSHYRGGWQVMFPNAGASSVIDGVPLPLHGEASSARPVVRDVRPDSVVLESATRRPLRLERRISIHADRPVLTIEERAINDTDWPMDVAWGQHPAFAVPAGTHIDLPPGPTHADADLDSAEVDIEPGATGSWPSIASRGGPQVDLAIVPEGPLERVVYLPDRPQPWAALRHPETAHGVALAWDGDAWPHVWLWQQLGGRRFPFFDRARIVALEPVNMWPADGLGAAIERGQGQTLEPAGDASAWMTLSLFEATSQPVVGVDRDGTITVERPSPD